MTLSGAAHLPYQAKGIVTPSLSPKQWGSAFACNRPAKAKGTSGKGGGQTSINEAPPLFEAGFLRTYSLQVQPMLLFWELAQG